MALSLVTAPTVEPLHLDEVKNHLKVDADLTADDALIQGLIVAAREWAERYTRRALITQTWDLVLDGFPAVIWVSKAPLQSITSITYTDSDGDSQTLSSSLYTVETPAGPTAQKGRIVPAYNEVWPTVRSHINVVTVRFVAGYGDTWNDVPQSIRQAMLLVIGEVYERREQAIVGTIINKVPMAAEVLAGPYRLASF